MRLIHAEPNDRRILRRFLQFPYDLYRRSPCWVPPLRAPLERLLRNGSGMQLGGGPYRLFLLEHEGKAVGRVLAGVNRVKNRQRQRNEGYFSLFECIDDPDAAKMLMSGAMDWLASKRVDIVTGPVSPTNGDDFRGIVIEGQDQIPAVNTTYTMPYYPRLLEEFGFTKYLDFHALTLVFDEQELGRLKRIVEYGRTRNRLEIRPLDRKDIPGEVRAIHKVMTASMLAHWEHLEVPTEQQIREEFESLKSLIDPELILIARIDGEPVGFVAGIPDYNQVLIHLKGRLTPLAAVKYLHFRKRISRIRMFMQFVLPQYQNTFVTPTLYLDIFERFTKRGYSVMEGSTIAESNLASIGTIRGVGFIPNRVYRIYQKPIERVTTVLRTLDADTVLELWSKTYNTDGKPDWSHIYPYYHPDVVFQDSIQRLEGIDAFEDLCARLTSRCRKLRMDISSIAQKDDTILMDWKMTMSFRNFPDSPIFGSTKLTLHEDGRIKSQRDFYDLWGDIFDGIPYFRKSYRRFMRKYFG